MGFLDAWARSYRNARALGAAVVLLAATGAMLSTRCDPVVEAVAQRGVVVVVEAVGLHPFGGSEPQARVVVAMPDSVRVRFFLPPPLPAAGDSVPVIVERHRRGEVSYAPDLTRWRTGVP